MRMRYYRATIRVWMCIRGHVQFLTSFSWCEILWCVVTCLWLCSAGGKMVAEHCFGLGLLIFLVANPREEYLTLLPGVDNVPLSQVFLILHWLKRFRTRNCMKSVALRWLSGVFMHLSCSNCCNISVHEDRALLWTVQSCDLPACPCTGIYSNGNHRRPSVRSISRSNSEQWIDIEFCRTIWFGFSMISLNAASLERLIEPLIVFF
jgi:hypothetical protein